MFADVAQAITAAGTYAAAFVAVLAALGAASRLRPIRWVWRRLVTMPYTAWLAAQHTEALAPIEAKLDALDAKVAVGDKRSEETAAQLIAHMDDELAIKIADQADRQERTAELDTRLGSIEARLDDGAARFDRVEDGIGKLTADVGRAMTTLGAGNPEVRPSLTRRSNGGWQP